MLKRELNQKHGSKNVVPVEEKMTRGNVDAANKIGFGAIYISGNREGLEQLGHGMVLVMTTFTLALKPGFYTALLLLSA